MELKSPNINPTDLQQTDFITSPEQLQGKKATKNPMAFGVPDMHNTGFTANPNERREAESAASKTTTNLNQEIIDERIKINITEAQGGNPPAPTDPKDILKYLIAKGSYEEKVEVVGHVWTMRALDQRDLMLIMEQLRDDLETQTARVTSIMFYQVIYSLEAVDGISIYEWFPEIKEKEFKSKEAYIIAIKNAIKEYFLHMPNSTIDSFYTEYSKIEEKRSKALVDIKNF